MAQPTIKLNLNVDLALDEQILLIKQNAQRLHAANALLKANKQSLAPLVLHTKRGESVSKATPPLIGEATIKALMKEYAIDECGLYTLDEIKDTERNFFARKGNVERLIIGAMYIVTPVSSVFILGMTFVFGAAALSGGLLAALIIVPIAVAAIVFGVTYLLDRHNKNLDLEQLKSGKIVLDAALTKAEKVVAEKNSKAEIMPEREEQEAPAASRNTAEYVLQAPRNLGIFNVAQSVVAQDQSVAAPVVPKLASVECN